MKAERALEALNKHTNHTNQMKTLTTLIALLTLTLSIHCQTVFSTDGNNVYDEMKKIGMPDQGSLWNDIARLSDYEGKSRDLNYHFKSWDEFDQYEKNGCVFANPISATLLLQDSTNWTGVVSSGKELGFVVTNYVAQIVYDGGTNYLTVKTTVSDIAKWRTPCAPNGGFPTEWKLIITNYVTTPFVATTNMGCCQ
jgi:hypothetical protein